MARFQCAPISSGKRRCWTDTCDHLLVGCARARQKEEGARQVPRSTPAVSVAMMKSLVSGRIPVADHRYEPRHLARQPVATRPGLNPAWRWRRTVTFASSRPRRPCWSAGPSCSGWACSCWPPRSRCGRHRQGPAAGTPVREPPTGLDGGLAPAGRDCTWCVLGAAVTSILVGCWARRAWLITLFASAAVTALLTAVPPAPNTRRGRDVPRGPSRPRSGRTPTRLPDRLDTPLPSGAPDG